jgi:hypothetical protein
MLRNMNPEINVLNSRYSYTYKNEVKKIPAFKKTTNSNSR